MLLQNYSRKIKNFFSPQTTETFLRRKNPIHKQTSKNHTHTNKQNKNPPPFLTQDLLCHPANETSWSAQHFAALTTQSCIQYIAFNACVTLNLMSEFPAVEERHSRYSARGHALEKALLYGATKIEGKVLSAITT